MNAIARLGRFFVPSRLPRIYIIYALCIGTFLIFATPPFQTPDAIAHFFRSIQIASGGIVGHKFDDTAGGKIDTSAIELANIFPPRLAKTSDALAARGSALKWNGDEENYSFPNTAVYPPYTYLPQVVAVVIGRALGMSVKNVYLLACAFDLFVSVAITCWALTFAVRTRVLLFSIALLPMTVSLYASVSQESSLLPVFFFLTAYIDRAIVEGRPITSRTFWVGATIMAACISARPPVVGLLILAFHPSLRFRNNETYAFGTRILFCLISVLVGMTVAVAFGVHAWTNFGPSHSIGGQLSFLMHNPLSIAETARYTLFPTDIAQSARHGIRFYFESFVGILGWLDAPMDGFYYAAALMMFGAAWLALPGGQFSTVPYLAAVVTIMLIFASLYMVWTPVGAHLVDGVQGRYFLMVAPIFALSVPTLTARARAIQLAAYATVSAFPVLTFVCVMRAILDRFYL